MDRSYYKVNGIATTPKSSGSSKDHHNNHQKEQKKEEKKTFVMENQEETEKKRTVSTLWGIYNLFRKGEMKSEELTGSTIYDLLTMLTKDKEEVDSTLLDRYHSLQSTEGIDRHTEESIQRKRTKNPKNYEKYKSFKE